MSIGRVSRESRMPKAIVKSHSCSSPKWGTRATALQQK